MENKQPRYYLQTSPEWKNADYSAAGESTTIGASGCGPTCAAMLIETLTGKTYTPVDACQWSLSHGYKAVNQGTYYAYFKPQFAAFGITCTQLNTSNVYGNQSAPVHAEALSLLQKGYYLIACMGKGLWTSSGHFVVVWWKDGKVRINDPASTKDERVNGDLKTFQSQVKYYWAIDARKYNGGDGTMDTTSKKITRIPRKKIARIQIYINTEKKSLATIMKETGADYGINGGLFEWSWEPCPIMKVGGNILAEYPKKESAWGYGWDTGSDIAMDNSYDKHKNFISCGDLINPWDGPYATLSYSKEVGGERGRSAIGLTADDLVLYCSKDGSTDKATPEEVRDEMRDIGCASAIMLDSGGSSQCNFNGKTIASTRKVHNVILVYLVGNTAAPDAPTNSNTELSGVKAVQTLLNKTYSAGIAVDGSWGPASKKAMIKAVQTEINRLYGGKLTVDGSWGAKSKAACPNIRKVTKNAMATLIQAMLVVRGYDIKMDGSYGPACERAIRAFQQANRLASDGVCGAATMTKLVG